MMEFDRWLLGQGQAAPATPADPYTDDVLDALEVIGVCRKGDGSFWARCCVCERDVDMCFDPLEAGLLEDDADVYNGTYQHYCGGGPRCCP